MRYADACCKYEEVFEAGEHFYVYTGPCIETGKPYSVKVPAAGLYAYRQGALAQNAFPDMSADDREFLISGYSPEGWNIVFGQMADDEDDEDTADYTEDLGGEA